MKRIISLVLSLLLCGLALVGCSNSNQATPAPTATPEPSAEATENSLEGILADYSGEIVTLNALDGNQYLFKVTGDTSFETDADLYLGDDVTIYFTGELNGTDTTGTTITRVVDMNNTDEGEQTVAGHVLEATMNTITISDVNNDALTFDTSTADISTVSGLEIGDLVYIDYRGTINGTDTSKCAVLRVIDNDDNATPNPSPVATSTPVPTAKPQPTLTPADQIQYVAQQDWMYVTVDTDMYRGNSTAYKKVGHVYVGQGITTLGYTNDGWILCSQSGVNGWVPAKDLTNTAPTTPTPKPTPTPVPPATHYVHITYTDTNGSKIFSDFVKVYAEGASYSIDSPIDVGMTPSIPTVYGTMGTTDVNVNVIYTLIVTDPTTVTGNSGPGIGNGAAPE